MTVKHTTSQAPSAPEDTKASPIIHVIGLGVTESGQFSDEARTALLTADLVIGSERQLNIIQPVLSHARKNTPCPDHAALNAGAQHSPHHNTDAIDVHTTQTHADTQTAQAAKPQQRLLPKLSTLKEMINTSGAEQVVILASGDPLYYGIGRWLSQQFSAERLRFYPAISSIQAACHSIGLSLQDAKVISLHGRPVLSLRRHLAQQQYLVVLTDQHSTPPALAALCEEAGFAESQLWVCERLGYQNQLVRKFSVSALCDKSVTSPDTRFDPLHVTIIKVIGQSRYLPSFPGIADQHFITNNEAGRGLITKREVRLAVLSLLQPAPADIGWDIGAGCGGVAVEWALWNPLGHVYAIEHHATRFNCLAQNQQRFGVAENLNPINGRAPGILATLPAANKIFIGGSDGELPSLLATLWENLPPQGVIVTSAVMETSKASLIQFAESLPKSATETLQIGINKGGELAGHLLYRPSLPVTLFKFTKHQQ